MNYWGKKPNVPPNGLLSGMGGDIVPTKLPNYNPLKQEVFNSSPNLKARKPQPKHNFPTYQPKFEYGKPKPKQLAKPNVTYESRLESCIPYAKAIQESKPEPFYPFADPRSNALVKHKEFLRVFNQLAFRFKPRDVWDDFITTFACAISNLADASHYVARESLYFETGDKYTQEEQALFAELGKLTIKALEYNPDQDFLGGLYVELGLDDNNTVTPYPICREMAGIMANATDLAELIKKEGYYSMLDPFCGSGGILIASVNEAKRRLKESGMNWRNHVLVAAQDISQTAALMSYIQLSILGAASYLKVGDTFTEFMGQNDTIENYWFTPMCFSKGWVMRWISQGGEPKKLK